nr:hypothetical protein CFP56_61364 [Quercus suber]
MRAAPERLQKSQLVEGMRNGGNREDGDVNGTGDRTASIPRKPAQGGQEGRGLRVGNSEPTNLEQDDAENTRKVKYNAEQVKPDLALEEDFERKLAEIDAGVHNEADRLMNVVGAEPIVRERSLCQHPLIKHVHLNGPCREESNGPLVKALMGSLETQRPNKSLAKELHSEQAQPERCPIFASASPAYIKEANAPIKQGKGLKKTKPTALAKGKENRAGVRSNTCMETMAARGVDMEVDREEASPCCQLSVGSLYTDSDECKTNGTADKGEEAV